MRSRLRGRFGRRLSYANVMSTLAVLLLLVTGGSAVAAGLAKNSVGSETIKDNKVKSQDIKDGTLGEADLGSSSVTSSELGTITRVEHSGTVNANTFGDVIATCPAGSVALSGGVRGDALGLYVLDLSKENVSEAWVAEAQNTIGTAHTITTFVYCLAG